MCVSAKTARRMSRFETLSLRARVELTERNVVQKICSVEVEVEVTRLTRRG